MTEPCKQEDLLREMHGNIKTLVAEFKSMNGTLVKTQADFVEHEKESEGYRGRIDKMWTGVHVIKWIILFLFGSGAIWHIVKRIAG